MYYSQRQESKDQLNAKNYQNASLEDDKDTVPVQKKRQIKKVENIKIVSAQNRHTSLKKGSQSNTSMISNDMNVSYTNRAFNDQS